MPQDEIGPMAKLLITRLLTVANAFAAAKGWKLSTLGMYAMRDATVFVRLANGKSTNIEGNTYDRAMRYFRDNAPDGFKWPLDLLILLNEEGTTSDGKEGSGDGKAEAAVQQEAKAGTGNGEPAAGKPQRNRGRRPARGIPAA